MQLLLGLIIVKLKIGGDNNTYLTVEILAKHGFSGFSKVFTKDYHSPEYKLKEGKFLSGNSCYIN